MSPELFAPEEFSLKDNRQTKHSDSTRNGHCHYIVVVHSGTK